MTRLDNLTGADLDINQRINLRALVQAWQRYTVERFQGELSTKLYGSRTNKKGVGRSLLGAGYRFGRKRNLRTWRLRNDWRSGLAGGEGALTSRISFLQYGRFVDMGVGRGVDLALSRYQRNKRNGETISRQAVRWYAKRKAYETHRLRELMVQHHIDIPLDTLENALSANISLTL